MPTNPYYPLFADLRGRRCVVVGGGVVAQRKVATLVRCGARVTVISPTVTGRLLAAARRGEVRHVRRRFHAGDLRGAWLVCAATDEARINQEVFRVATRKRILANVVDQPPLCSFVAPSIFRRGALTIAISTGGASPALAKHLRLRFQRMVGSEYSRMLQLLERLRPEAKRRLPGFAPRRRYFAELVDGRVFDLVRAGKMQAARREALARLESAANNGTR